MSENVAVADTDDMYQPSYSQAISTNVHRPGGCNPSELFNSEFLMKLSMGMFFEEFNGDSYNDLSLSRDLETQGHLIVHGKDTIAHDLHLQGHGVALQQLYIDIRTF